MYFPDTYNCIPLSVLVNLVIRLCTGSYIYLHLFGVLSLVVVVEDIYIYWGCTVFLGFYWVALSFYLLCCAKEVNLYN